MEQLSEIRKAQQQRYQLHRQKILEEEQKKSDEDNAKIQLVEKTKEKLRTTGYKIHNYKNIKEMWSNIKGFRELIEKAISIFQEYDFDDTKEIFNRIIYNLQSGAIHFNITTREEKMYVQEIQMDIKRIVELLQLPENIIEFDFQMDVDHDMDMAKLLSQELNPKIY